jgi:hypothetical protein
MVCVCVHAYRDASADAGWERFVWMLPQVVCTTHVLVTTCTTHALANPHTQIYTHAHENKQIHTYTHRFTPTYAQKHTNECIYPSKLQTHMQKCARTYQMAGNAFKRDRQRVIFAVRQESGRSAFVGGSAEWIGAGGQAAED